MNKKACSYIVFDVETGGLKPEENPVCSIAMLSIRGDTFQEIDRYEGFVKPYDDGLIYNEKALEVNGLTKSWLEKNGKDIQTVVEEMAKLFEKSSHKPKRQDTKPILVGHNTPFDIGFVQQMFSYAKGMKLEDYVKGKKDIWGNFQPAYFDTIDLGRAKWCENEDNIKNFKLETCIEKAELDITDAHSAMNDVIATKELFVTFMQQLRSGQSEGGEQEEYRFRKTFEF